MLITGYILGAWETLKYYEVTWTDVIDFIWML